MGEVSDRLNSALSGRYAIEREIGAGGMATVYLARDLRHNRKVALKILRPELAAVLGTERFLSEIQVTAGLQHPHLLPLFDSGEAEGLLFYVMPFVEGESLRARLERERQLPVEEAIRIAAAVAGALDYAHRHGVIHRDLKPENILLHDGQPLVADFGIALAVSSAGGSRVTRTGISVGTPTYMSPEQAAGDRPVDGRSDVYSLATVAYEMLVGDPPHAASTAQALITKVLTEQAPRARSVRGTVPEHVDDAIQTALAKLPADRFGTAEEFGRALAGQIDSLDTRAARRPLVASLRSSERLRRALIPASYSLIGILLGAVAFSLRSEPAAPLVLDIALPDSVAGRGGSLTALDLAIAQDGSAIAFRGTYRGVSAIYLRRLDGSETQLVRGTEEGIGPIFSPNGRWILFYVGGDLRRVPVDGGLPAVVADSADLLGAAWGDQGTVIFNRAGALWRVDAEEGTPTLLASLDSARGHVAYRWPQILPGERAALITLWKERDTPENAELGVVRLADGTVTELGIQGTSPRFLTSGHVVFARFDGSALAIRFSPKRLRAEGPAVPVLEGVRVNPSGAAYLVPAANGTVVYRRAGPSPQNLVSIDRRGRKRLLFEEPRPFSLPRVSPDGRRVAVMLNGVLTDIWTLDIESKTLTRMTDDGQSEGPEWTADGRRIAYGSADEIKMIPADGSGQPSTLIPGAPPAIEISLPISGRWMAVRRGRAGAADIWIAPVDSPQAIKPFLSTEYREGNPRISPDGGLLAYASNEGERGEIYVRPMPGTGPRVQVSAGGGQEPIWSSDGLELFYRGSGYVMAASIRRTPDPVVVRRDSLFPDPFVNAPGGRIEWDVTPNGEFVMTEPLASGSGPLVAIVNWHTDIRRRLGERQ